jgi:triacylglycerol esterase/lipase EstA (alpha/beta hydrolase family)
MSDLSATTQSEASVILVHGLWMNGGVLLLQQRWLRERGFSVRRFSYPSWHGSLADNVGLLSRFVAETPGETIHLVAHSLGGLVSLSLLADTEEKSDPRIHRLVLMATPCAGSHCGDVLHANPALAALTGRTYKDWSSRPRRDVRSDVEVGVIAGTEGIGMGRLIPGLTRPNDGLITVAETALPTAKDRIELPVSHSGMLVSPECSAQVASFLRNGAFAHD